MLIWWSYITIHESRQYVVYRNIKLQYLQSIPFTCFTSPPLAREHKTDKHTLGNDKAYSNSSYIHWIITAQVQNRDKTCSSAKTFSRKLQSMIFIFVDVFITSYILNSVRSCYMKNASMHTAHKTGHHSRNAWKEYILLSLRSQTQFLWGGLDSYQQNYIELSQKGWPFLLSPSL